MSKWRTILSDPPAARAAVMAAAVAAAAFAVIVIAVVASGRQTARLADDQERFHLPTVRQFAAQLPRPDLTDYRAATTPGYHLALATFDRLTGGNVKLLRIAGGGFGVLLIATTAYGLTRIGGPRAAWLCAPLALSIYVITSAGWLLPEDAAWWLATAVVVFALTSTASTRLYVTSAALLAGLVFVRQSAIWAAAAVIVVAMLDESESGAKRFGKATLTLAPALLVLAAFARAWHGLVPPSFQAGGAAAEPWVTQYGGLSAGGVLMTLAMLGLFGTPLIGWFWQGRHSWRPALIGAAVGLIVGAALPSDYHFPDRRSGIWTVVAHAPLVLGRSPVMAALAVLGGATTAVAVRGLPRRAATILAATLAGFVCVQLANPFLWQRYYEPFALIWLALAAAASLAPVRPRWRGAGAAALCLLQVAVLVQVLFFTGAE